MLEDGSTARRLEKCGSWLDVFLTAFSGEAAHGADTLGNRQSAETSVGREMGCVREDLLDEESAQSAKPATKNSRGSGAITCGANCALPAPLSIFSFKALEQNPSLHSALRPAAWRPTYTSQSAMVVMRTLREMLICSQVRLRLSLLHAWGLARPFHRLIFRRKFPPPDTAVSTFDPVTAYPCCSSSMLWKLPRCLLAMSSMLV